MDRDLEVHRLTARLRALRRFSLDLCLGRIVPADGSEPVYVGRLGLTDRAGRRLLVDWRSPAAEPFFGATHGDPMGLASRRRYRWTARPGQRLLGRGVHRRRVRRARRRARRPVGVHRQPRRQPLAPDARRARHHRRPTRTPSSAPGRAARSSSTAGPGTGKTVVALHRTAYLLYADPRLGHRRGGVLFVGPHQPYLAYVADVLPSLGEEGVQTCTVRDLVPEGAGPVPETDPEVARLKSTAAMVRAIEPAVAVLRGATDRGDGGRDALGRRLAERRTTGPRRSGRPTPVRRTTRRATRCGTSCSTILVDKHDATTTRCPPDRLRRALAAGRRRSPTPSTGRGRCSSRPTSSGDLWSVPAYLRHCAPWLEPDEVRALQRADPQAWTVSDLPLLDAARQRLGDPEASRRRRRHEAAVAAEREQMADVVDDLVAHDDSEMKVMSMLRGLGRAERHRRRGRPAHRRPGPARRPVRARRRRRGPGADRRGVADAAAPLPVAQLHHRRRPGPGPARLHGVVGGAARAGRAGRTSTLASLRLNYRTPEEVMAEAEPVIRAALPDANVPTSVRSSGVPVAARLARRPRPRRSRPGSPSTPRASPASSATPTLRADAAGAVALPGARQGPGVRPGRAGRPGRRSATGIEGAVDRYVAMTRATQQLVVLTSS